MQFHAALFLTLQQAMIDWWPWIPEGANEPWVINQRNGKILTERWVSETKNVKDGFSIIIIHQNCTLYESNVFNCGNCNFSSYRMIFSAGRPSASEAAGEDWTLPGRAVCHCSMYCILVEDGKSWCKMRNLLQVVADHHTTLVQLF